MRTKEKIIEEYSTLEQLQANGYLFLEVLIDIRDQLVELNKFRYSKLGDNAALYKEDDD